MQGFAVRRERIACREPTDVRHFEGRPVLQRFFSAFPGGLPGLGLLLLRLALAAALVGPGAAALAGGPEGSGVRGALGLLAAASGGALVVGVFTPVAGSLAALVTLGLTGWRVALGDVLALAVPVALVLLGPGAFSVDARVFGRHEIVVPRAGRSESGSRASHGGNQRASA
jgi:hypothetical protein